MISKEGVRVLSIIIGATVATAEGVQLYLADGESVVTWEHLLAAGAAAFAAWLMKSPIAQRGKP